MELVKTLTIEDVNIELWETLKNANVTERSIYTIVTKDAGTTRTQDVGNNRETAYCIFANNTRSTLMVHITRLMND